MQQLRGGVVQRVEHVRSRDDADGLAIGMGEAPGSINAWIVAVEVQLESGLFRLGTFTTTPPGAGDPPSRIVAICNCPGVKRWYVTLRTPSAAAVADIELADGAWPGLAGVTAIAHPPGLSP